MILTLALCLSLSAPAFAAEEKHFPIFVYYRIADTPDLNATSFFEELLTEGAEGIWHSPDGFVFKQPDGSTIKFEEVFPVWQPPAFTMSIPSPKIGVYTLVSCPLPAGYEFEDPLNLPSFTITEEQFSTSFYQFPIWIDLKAVGATEPAPVETPSSWATGQVNAAIAAGLVPRPLQSKYTQAATRAEFCALAVALYENKKGEITGRATFADTNDVNVQKAAAISVVSGVGDNKFAPDAQLTREQAATMLARLADALGKPLPKQSAAFADNSSISSWAIEAAGQAQAAGIMGGVGNNIFSPKDPYTREQSVITILRLYDTVN